jgi:hypothetical protein
MKLAGGENEWNAMWSLYLNETDAQERIKLLQGLAHSSEPWILHRSVDTKKVEQIKDTHSNIKHKIQVRGGVIPSMQRYYPRIFLLFILT